MKKLALVLTLVMLFALAAPAVQAQEVTTIEYWQYYFESKIALVDELIAQFESENPDIKVVHQNFPYDSFQEKIAASVAAGQGPDIVNLFYGWVPTYVKSGVLQPLPSGSFSPEAIEADFAPMVTINKFDGVYYTIPTAVRTLGLFYNKDILKENGYDAPPATLDEMVEMAVKMTRRNAAGDLEVEGMTFQPDGQLHGFFRPVLLNLFGQKPMSEDHKTVLWNASEAGYEAFQWLTDLATVNKVGEVNFMTNDATAFRNGVAAMSIDGSYRISALEGDGTLDYGVAPIPSHEGRQSSFGTFWTNGILANTKGKELEASEKFLAFLTSEPVMKLWTERIGEIGARTSISQDEELLKNDKLAPFISMLPYADSYFYVDEAADRQIVVDAIDQVLLNDMDPREVLDWAVEEAQNLVDSYWN
ncbi:MAG: extracellular solute-binding protein [Clostridiales bacterium]|nr:extracellular solute-binding protein [Clostridiales bacterium]